MEDVVRCSKERKSEAGPSMPSHRIAARRAGRWPSAIATSATTAMGGALLAAGLRAAALPAAGLPRASRGKVTVARSAVPQVTLFTKPGCTLCDKAMAQLKETTQPFELSTVNIEAPGNESWRSRYWCDIPVFHINGAFWAKHRLDAEDVEASLSAAQAGTFAARDGEPDSRQHAECGDDCNCGGECCEGH
eukprot:s624_g24.t1